MIDNLPSDISFSGYISPYNSAHTFIDNYMIRLNFFFFFLNDPATPDIYPLPLPDPLPIPTQRRPPSRTRQKYGEPPAESTTTVVSRPTLQGVRPGPATLSTGFLLRACIPESYSGVPRF